MSYRRRSIIRSIADEVEAVDRFVDIGVTLHIVRADDRGQVLIPGARKMTQVGAPKPYGFILDTKTGKRVPGQAGTSRNPQDWFCSEDQWKIIEHSDSAPVGQLAIGGMGAGKTTAGVIWMYLRWLENLGQRLEGGITAPTETRLSLVFNEFFRMFPGAWYRFQSSTGVITMCEGTRLRGVSTYQQSDAQGSRIQGFNWSWWLGDEMQDQIEQFKHIQARLRSKADGRAKQLGTATSKDSPDWRTLKGSLVESGFWVTRTLLGPNSPFVHPDHWERQKKLLSKREFRRLALAEDLPPEGSPYPEWSRITNLVTVSDLGWVDVTAHELRASGPVFDLLVGHDPGLSIDVSLFLKAYVPPGKSQRDYLAGKVKPWWVVLGELNTEQSTTEHHIGKLLETVRDRWQLNLLTAQGRANPSGRQMLVRADPAGNSDNRTDKTVYTQFANAGIRIKPAAYNAEGDGHGRVPREAGVELVSTLICNAANERRLFVAKNPDGSPAAPMLVKAIETSERDWSGRAEVHSRKGRDNDVTHWPAALRYALWAIERPRLQVVPRSDDA